MNSKPFSSFLRAENVLPLTAIAVIATAATFFFAWASYILVVRQIPDFASLWQVWDTTHFLQVAEKGYIPEIKDKVPMVVFPFYPLLIRGLSLITGNMLVSSLLLANAAYAGAVVYFYKLARLEQDAETSLRAVLYMALWPTAFFFHAGYTESPFLFLALAAFYYARKGNWAAAALLGMAASGMRILGALLLPALVLEYFTQKNYQLKKTGRDVLWLLLIPTGLLIYMAICWKVSGNPFQYVTLQELYWQKRLAFPWTGFINTFHHLRAYGPEHAVYNILELFFGLLGMVISGYALRHFRPSYAVFVIAIWLMSVCTARWVSNARYTLMMFPVFIALAAAGKKPAFHYPFLFTCLLFYGLLLSRFVRWSWAF